MKTKKIVIGAMAAAMLSLSVCSIAPAVAADETVQISVSKTTAEAGGEFKVDVSLADIPTTGLQCCNFAIKYDPKVLTIKDITAGTLAGTVSGDASSSMLPNFNNYSQEGLISVMWSTSVDDASKWLKGEGTFCTITGTVAAGTANGTVSEITVLPTSRETYDGSGVMNDAFDCGYLKDGVKVNFNVKPNAGSVTIGSEETTTTPPATTTTTTENKPGVSLRGDANLDNKVSVADAVAILQSIANKDKYALKPQGAVNGDVEGNNDGITGADALRIQKWDAGAITTL
uniref:Scaffoldin C n=1 Tax=Ruminococcus flavefaciens TaxID=1265 RepID=G9FDC9_RUMFL|nr:scaffoldin C [Ruminococcus flavefaciens]AEV58554.1 scaffoldin C [Ruminococcus flavefaciens]AEV58565.1 scaffoldin C [Ruminococcus flavefaciens]AEV58566.1 scaffoldin C [Ruminococcus flavefaciens]AEV58567.1 scaffoldin C [Ruminococcus flavefaciens]